LAKGTNNKVVGIVLLVVGVVLLVQGGLLGSGLDRALHGNVRVLAMLIGGGVCAVLGVNKLR